MITRLLVKKYAQPIIHFVFKIITIFVLRLTIMVTSKKVNLLQNCFHHKNFKNWILFKN